MNKKEILSEIKKIEIVIRKRLSGNSAGFYVSAYRGSGIELEGIKEYSDEDDFRLIDWNAFARTGRPFTLVMQEERGLELYLLVDVSASMAGGGTFYPVLQNRNAVLQNRNPVLQNRNPVSQDGRSMHHSPLPGSGAGASGVKSAARKTKLETAAVVAAILGLSASSNRDKTAAILFSGKVEETIISASGRGHIFSIAEKIIDSRPLYEGSDLEAACRALPKSFRKKGICIIISDMEYDIPWQTLLQISSRVETAIFRIRDIDESENLNLFSYESEGIDPRGYFFIKRKTKTNFPAAKNGDKDFSDAVKYDIPLVDISTSDNIVEKINNFFKIRKR